MKHIEDLKREVDTIKYEVEIIQSDVKRIKDKLIDHTPEHFSSVDFIRAFIGAMFLGFSVLFSGNLINMAAQLPTEHFYVIVFGTILLLTIQIYIIGYKRVTEKNRGFTQFWLKRIVAFYFIALLVAYGLSFIFGLQYLLPTHEHFLRVVLVLSAPCAVGAALADLLKKY